MNWASAKNLIMFLSRKNILLIVAAVVSVSIPSLAANKKVPTQNVDIDSADMTGERLLYSKVIDSYQAKQLAELNRAVALMLKGYPNSVHADDAVYLKANLQLSRGQYQNSLDTIETLLKNYPDSNKRVSALYLKAQVLKQTRQVYGAEAALKEIQQRYPGSIEAAKIYSEETAQK